jgi:hypothetical protein
MAQPANRVPADKLIVGHRYAIIHSLGQYPTETGTFQNLLIAPDRVHANFDHLNTERNPVTKSAYREGEWTFHEIGHTLREVRALQSVGRQRPKLTNTAITEIGKFLTEKEDLSGQFKDEDDKNKANGVSQARGGRRRSRRSLRSRKTRRSRK